MQTHRFPYEKVKAGDTQLGKAMTLVKSKQQRDKKGKVLLEGKRLITDAILAGAVIETIYFCRHEALEDVPVDSLDAKFVKVPQKDVSMWSDVASPQGILAVCKKPDTEKLCLLQDEMHLPVTLICDNIREPGNLGALLRSAAAVNCRNVLVTKGCVDTWEPKVLRAGCGAHFRISIQSNISWKEMHLYLDSYKIAQVHVADGNFTEREQRDYESYIQRKGPVVLEKKSDKILMQNLAAVLPIIAVEAYFQLDWTNPCALVIGGESHGLSLEAVELCEKSDGSKVFIPMSNGMNSLNSAHAASIILYEARRQLIEKSPR
ncbi:rRNA methyltransferase 3, mitochondrial-like [Anneissia japonica]|uniref:rRNA methyltransferase 3, mitochondrial-like n=1 Tax=Anneissia japonica TaxID=1529436 RepID=UPI0014256858|nr:rRNA methyltransferase 3, mitochondrial-like [Anneissia japonica]